MTAQKDRDEDRRPLRDVGVYTAIPMMLLAGPALGYWIGLQAEKLWGQAPWFSVGGAIFGLVAAIRQVVRIIRTGSASP